MRILLPLRTTARLALLLAVICAVPAPGVRADTTAADAPNDVAHAMDVPLADINGTIGGSDTADWYRIAIAPDTGVQVSVIFLDNGSYPFVLLLDTDSGTYLDKMQVTHVGANFSVAFVQGGAGKAVRIGFVETAPTSEIAYSLHVTAIDLPDVAVDKITLAGEPGVPTPAGSILSAPTTITVSISNLAPTSTGGTLDVYAFPSEGFRYRIASVAYSIDAASTTSITVPWNTFGTAGDVTIQAVARTVPDYDYTNNVLETVAHVLVDGHGQGVVAAPHPLDCQEGLPTC